MCELVQKMEGMGKLASFERLHAFSETPYTQLALHVHTFFHRLHS